MPPTSPRPSRPFLLAALAAAALAPPSAFAAPSPTLEAPMDDASFTATGPAGRIEAKGGVSRVESATGLSGAAARLSSGDTLEYPVKDVFGEDRGAVAFWMKPGFDAGSSFGLWKWESGGKTTMEFFKGSSPRLYFRMRGPEKREVTFTLPDDFDYDAWHHVVLGWDKDYGDDGRVAMWVDGELGSTGGWKVDGLEQMAATMSFSGPMTIDQLQGFDQILSSEEAAALAAAKPSVSGGPGGPAAAGDNLQEQDNPALLGDGSGGEQKKQSMTAMLLGEEQAKRVQQLEDRQSQWTVLPRVDLQPGYTQSARETFTLDMGAVGRRNVEDVAWKLNGQPLPESTWSIDGGTLTLTPDRDLREGLNLFEISYEHPQAPGEAGERIRFEFPVNHQTGGSRVHYREDGAVVVDGEALFAVGGFRSGQTDDYTDALPTAAAAGLDFVHAYANDRVRDIKEAGLEEHIEKVRGYLRAAHENGLGVLLALPREAITEYDEPILTRWIAELSGEPGLWFWYLYDEPDPRHVPPASTGAASELVKRLDPHHPLVVVCNRESGTLIYGPQADAVWPDRYPVTATGREMVSLSPVYADMVRNREMVGPDKPMTPVLQIHDNRSIPWLRKSNPELAMPSDADHRPTVAEVRAMSHLALASGVKTLSYYWAPSYWYSLKEDASEHWRNFGKMVKEFEGLEEVLLADAPGEPPRLEHDPTRKVNAWSREHDGQLWIGLVNPDIFEPVEVRLPGRGFEVHEAWSDSVLDGGERATVGPAGVLIVKGPLPAGGRASR